ncbi:hypothetical protein [Furfurilactobacillus entadae]
MADKKQFELAEQDYQAGMTYPAIAQKVWRGCEHSAVVEISSWVGAC